MKTLKLSIHSPEQIWLRQLLIKRRGELGLTQRTLAERLDVVYSFVGKVETGERRLDIFEFITYCIALDLDSLDVLRQIEKNFYENGSVNLE